MYLAEDFIPDYTNKLLTGLICNRNSNIRNFGNLSYISIFNRINVWNIKTLEIVCSYGTQKYPISCFELNENYIAIGYENGKVEIISRIDESKPNKIVRLHSKKITKIILHDEIMISSSLDGTICTYDFIYEDVKIRYNGNVNAVHSIYLNQDRIIAVCSDRALKIWYIDQEIICDAIAFEDNIFDGVFKVNEGFIILENGQSYLLNLQNKEMKRFENFKNPRNLLFRDSNVVIQCQKKTIVYKTSSENIFGLTLTKRLLTSPDFISCDFHNGNLIFISKNNNIQINETIIDFGFHQNDILDVKIHKNKIYSLSKDKMVSWLRSQESIYNNVNLSKLNLISEENLLNDTLESQHVLQLKNAKCFEIFGDLLVIGNHEGIWIYDRKFYELKKEIKIGSISSLAVYDKYLAVSYESSIVIFDENFNEVESKSAPDIIVYTKFSPNGRFFMCSCLDNKVYLYNYPSMDLKLSLYGHSLPVRYFSISDDETTILTAGADKLIKMWGLEFGECRKTFIGDSKNVEFLKDSLFMFCDKDIQYYNNHEKLRQFRIFGSGIIKFGPDYMIATSGRGLCLYNMNKLEFAREDESEEMEVLGLRNITSLNSYDTFLGYLESLEKDFHESTMKSFYKYLLNSDITDLKEYLFVLDNTSIHIILRVIEQNINENTIINSRLLSHLFRCHREVCLSNDIFHNLKLALTQRITQIRDLASENDALLEICKNDIDYDEELENK